MREEERSEPRLLSKLLICVSNPGSSRGRIHGKTEFTGFRMVGGITLKKDTRFAKEVTRRGSILILFSMETYSSRRKGVIRGDVLIVCQHSLEPTQRNVARRLSHTLSKVARAVTGERHSFVPPSFAAPPFPPLLSLLSCSRSRSLQSAHFSLVNVQGP